MNLSKLAQIANVSVSTVSKAFSDSKEISEQTKEMILNVAKEYGCYDKYYKPKYQKKLIAVICPEMLGIHYTQMATYLNNEITSHGGTMLLSVFDFSPSKEQELIDYYTRFSNADGIIVIEPTGVIKNSSDIPIVQIGNDNESKNVDCVKVDANEAIDDAIRYLKSKGYKSFGFIGEKYAKQEYDYFLNGLKRNYILANQSYIEISENRFYDAGYYTMDKFIKNKNIPDVIFGAYSHITVGIMQRLKEEGLCIPKDVSIMSMDDITSVPYSDIKMSCIKMHLDEVCATALDLLFQKIEKKHIKAKRTLTITRQFLKGETIK